MIDWKWTVLSKFKLISSYFITEAIPRIHFVFVVMLVSLFCVARKMRHAKDCSYASSRYDAFLSHNVIKEINADFVHRMLPLKTPKGSNFEFESNCVANTDLVVGQITTDKILKAVQSSRRILILISKHYVNSGWCASEFYDAYQSVTSMAMRQSKTLEGYIEPQNTYEILAKDLVPGKNCDRQHTKTNSEQQTMHDIDFENFCGLQMVCISNMLSKTLTLRQRLFNELHVGLQIHTFECCSLMSL